MADLQHGVKQAAGKVDFSLLKLSYPQVEETGREVQNSPENDDSFEAKTVVERAVIHPDRIRQDEEEEAEAESGLEAQPNQPRVCVCVCITFTYSEQL